MSQAKTPTILSILTLVLIGGLYLKIGFSRQNERLAVTPSHSQITSDEIANMLQRGIRINSENNPELDDADLYGSALIQIAMEHFASTPEAAPKIRPVFASHLKNMSLSSQYVQWGIFLEYLDRSLNRCLDAQSLTEAWRVRSAVAKDQRKLLFEIASEADQQLETFVDTLTSNDQLTSNLAGLAEEVKIGDEMHDTLDFLLEVADSEEDVPPETMEKIDSLFTRITAVSDLINKSLDTHIDQLAHRLEQEKLRDTSPEGTEAYVPEHLADDSGNWKTGAYQNLLNDVLQLNMFLENESFTYWNTNANENEDIDSTATVNNGRTRLTRLFEETRRMQAIRYNLWASRRLSSNATYDTLSLIDPGLLTSSVGAIFSMKESELMQGDTPTQRATNVRKVLLRIKAGLDAF